MGQAGGSQMRRFWDSRAREDPYYFINSSLAYRNPDVERFWASGEEDIERILGRLGLEVRPTDTLVEVGCGIGRMTRAFSKRAAKVVALDVSAEMVERAQRENPGLANVEWIVGDGRSLSGVADASADACFSFVVFQHIPDPEVTLGYVREIGRVLRPGGWAGLQISNSPEPHRQRPLSRRVRDLIGAARRRLPRGWSHPAWRGSHVDLERLQHVASEAGLETERVLDPGTQFCFVRMRKRPATGTGE